MKIFKLQINGRPGFEALSLRRQKALGETNHKFVLKILCNKSARKSNIEWLSLLNKRLAALLYSGCQKNDPLFERFFLQPLIPALCISEFIFEKRYKFPVNCLQAQIFMLKID